MKGKNFIVFTLFGVLLLSSATLKGPATGKHAGARNAIATAHQATETIQVTPTPRKGQSATLEMTSNFSAINTIFDKGATGARAMVYVNATKSGNEYIDITSIKNTNGRLEILVLDGETNEHLNPFLVDKDGRTYVFGSTNGSSMAGSAYYERVLDVKNAANNKTSSLTETWAPNNTTQFAGTSWHGIPVNRASHNATKSEFVYYHLNLNSNNYRNGYTEWAAGLNLAPSGNDFDFANVKLAGFYMNKQHADQTNVKWDIKVLSMSVRSGDTGQRIELFNAENTVMTTSNATLWNDRVDQDGKSYVYQWVNNAIASNVTTTIRHDLSARTTSESRPIHTYSREDIAFSSTKSGDAWLYAFSQDHARFAALDLTGYNGLVYHIDNKTGAQLTFDLYLVHPNKGNLTLNKMFLYSDDGKINGQLVTTNIPEGFKGYALSLFEQNSSLADNSVLSTFTNEMRFVVKHTAASNGTKFTFGQMEFVKNGFDIRSKVSVDTFIKTLRLDTYDSELTGSGDNSCLVYFEEVKASYNTLLNDAKELFWSAPEYEVARARLLSWASANNYSFDNANNLSKNVLSMNVAYGSQCMIMIVGVALTLAFSVYVFQKRKKSK